MELTQPTIALEEEIGDPRLFTGRSEDLKFFLDWIDLVRSKLGNSQVVLARKRRGKTALVQRLYNILYSRNDPLIVPFYFRVPQGKMTTLNYCQLFMRHLLCHVYGYLRRKPEYIRRPLEWEELVSLLEDEPILLRYHRQLSIHIAKKDSGSAWDLTREAGHHIAAEMNLRVVQIIDEFQYLNTCFYRDEGFTTLEALADFYQKTGSSKISPQIITGSYVGWLTRIVNHMVGRYFHYYLDVLPEAEAMACVYRYASVYGRQVTETSAAYLAAVCHNDPYYIASMFTHPQKKDLRSEEGVRDTLEAVTNPGGAVDNMWLEYITSAFERINDRTAKKVVLYLAHHEPEERTCDQMIEDLGLSLNREELQTRLKALAYADLIRQVNDFRYQGLGDPVFAMVFRKLYAESIENVHPDQTRADIRNELKALRGRVSFYKGAAAEARVGKKLVFLSLDEPMAAQLLLGPDPSLVLTPFVSAYDHVFQLPGGARITVDLYCQSKSDGPDLVVEVKDWEASPGRAEIETFSRLRDQLIPHLERKTYFLFHSETPLSNELQSHATDLGLWYSDGERLKGSPRS